jgi:multimeric flavodoxin WrbA
MMKGKKMNPKKIVILRGSPRKNGNSNTLADELTSGAKSVGAEVHNYFLQDMHLEGCSGCDACQVNADEHCIIDDDMQQIYPVIKSADAIVYASAIYWFTYTAQLKTAIDRLYVFESAKGSALMNKPVGVLLTYGDSDQIKSGVNNAIHSFQDMFRYLKAPIVGIVHGTAMNVGDVNQNKKLMKDAFDLGVRLAQ